MKKVIILIVSFFMLSNFSVADTNSPMTMKNLNGYHVMTGIEISEMLLGETVILKDLLSEAVYEIKISQNGLTEKKIITAKSPKTLTNVEYQARADILSGDVKFSIEGSKIITTDGVRTYISTLYKKDRKIYGVRDVDNESVNFQILIDYKKEYFQ